MRSFLLCILAFLAVTPALSGGDPYCPKYPPAVRTEMEASLALDRDFQAYSKAARPRSAAQPPRTHLADSGNFIDQIMARRLTADGVESAPRTTDAEFLRRIYLDVTGRIPSPDQAERFLKDTSADKRTRLIDEL